MADFRINVIVDPADAERGTRRVDRSLRTIDRTANQLRNTLARAFAVIGTTAGAAGSIRLLANFSQAMSTVRAVTGATEEQFIALSAEAERLGATTRFSATQAAEGILFLSRAGFDAEESLQAVESTLLLAQAGALNLGTAADIASNILTGFRLEVDQLTRVTDVLALTANSANTNVEQLGTAMQFVAPVAAGLNVSIEEATAAIGTLSDAGLQASLAGTGLRRVLSELESPSNRTREIFSLLGVASEEVRVSQVGLTAALQRLRDAGIDTGIALEVFGDRGGPAFEVLSNAVPRVTELTEQLRNAEGTALDVARVMDDNLNGALLAVRSAIESVIIRFGALGAQQFLTEFFNDLANSIREFGQNLEFSLTIIGLWRSAIIEAGESTQRFSNEFLLVQDIVSRTVSLILESLQQLPVNLVAITRIITVEIAAIIRAAVAPISALIDVVADRLGDLGRGDIEGALQSITIGTIELTRTRIEASRQARQAAIQDILAVRDAQLEAFRTERIEIEERSRLRQIEQEQVRARIDEPRRDIIADTAVAAPPVDLAFLEVTRNLERESELLRLSNREREIRTELFSIEDMLGRQLTGSERERIQAQLESNQRLSEQRDLLEDIRGPNDDYIRTLESLNELLADNEISLRQFNEELINSRLALLETSTEATAGFERFFLRLEQEASDSATIVENVLTSAFRRSEEALLNFVENGELSFRSLAESILRDLARIAARQATLQIFSAAFGAGGGGGASAGGQAAGAFFQSLFGAQFGADFMVRGAGGTDSQLVAFRATPGERVTVQPQQSQVSRPSGSAAVNNFTFNYSGPQVETFRLAERAQIDAFNRATSRSR